jgi:hypothetical protein
MTARRASPGQRRAVALLVGLAILALILEAGLGGGGLSGPPPAGRTPGPPAGDPFAYRASRASEFVARAASGSAQVLFLKSPGGAMATAARVNHYRAAIVAAVRGSDIPAGLLEGLVFVESAGRPDVIAGSDVSDAVGLTQILAATGRSLLGMPIDLGRSRSLTDAIGRAVAAGRRRRAAQLEAERAQIDPRFDPGAELRATVRYLEFAERYLHRVDLAVASYHAGVGNVQHELALYDSGGIVPYAQLYFDVGPSRHAAAWTFLSGLGDDSSRYLWRVTAAEQLMALYRRDPAALRRLSSLESSYPSNALVLVPPGVVPRFDDPAALSGAYRDGSLVPLPRNLAALGVAVAPGMGDLARRLAAPRALYRGLRPAALRMLVEIAALVRRLSGARAPLTVASTVLDGQYDRLLGFDDPPATTGYTFQIERHYASGTQAQAFQFVLDRLQALNLIAWVRGVSTIEITVAPDAGSVLAHGV